MIRKIPVLSVLTLLIARGLSSNNPGITNPGFGISKPLPKTQKHR